MLKPAILYEEELKKKYNSVAFEEKYKYYNSQSYFDFIGPLATDTFNYIQMVSVEEDDIIGFLTARIDRGDDAVSSISAINFYDVNTTFSRDFHNFLDQLFTKFNFRKISFGVVVGNPAEVMYDKYIKKYNGRIVGVKEDDVRLFDNKLYDYKMYEIFREDYLQRKEERK